MSIRYTRGIGMKLRLGDLYQLRSMPRTIGSMQSGTKLPALDNRPIDDNYYCARPKNSWPEDKRIVWIKEESFMNLHVERNGNGAIYNMIKRFGEDDPLSELILEQDMPYYRDLGLQAALRSTIFSKEQAIRFIDSFGIPQYYASKGGEPIAYRTSKRAVDIPPQLKKYNNWIVNGDVVEITFINPFYGIEQAKVGKIEGINILTTDDLLLAIWMSGERFTTRLGDIISVKETPPISHFKTWFYNPPF